MDSTDYSMPKPFDSLTLRSGRYGELIEAERMLNALLAVGVDNWEGYEMAMELVRDEHY